MVKKPALSLRKPPAPVDAALAERFVQSGDGSAGAAAPGRLDVQAPAPLPVTAPVTAPAPPAGARGVLARKDGRELRRMTLYLPSDLARRLAVHCATHDLEMSEVVTAAVRRHLDD